MNTTECILDLYRQLTSLSTDLRRVSERLTQVQLVMNQNAVALMELHRHVHGVDVDDRRMRWESEN